MLLKQPFLPQHQLLLLLPLLLFDPFLDQKKREKRLVFVVRFVFPLREIFVILEFELDKPIQVLEFGSGELVLFLVADVDEHFLNQRSLVDELVVIVEFDLDKIVLFPEYVVVFLLNFENWLELVLVLGS